MLLALGLADLMAGAIFLAQAFGIKPPVSMVICFALYLLIKGTIFIFNSMDFASFLDFSGGILLLIGVFFTLPAILLGISALYLIAKGILTSLA